MARRKLSVEEEAAQIAGPRTFGAAAIARVCGVSVRKIYDDMDRGKLKCSRLTGRRLSTQEQIDEYRFGGSSVTQLATRRGAP